MRLRYSLLGLLAVLLTGIATPAAAQIALPVMFEESINYELTDFGGATQSMVIADPTDATNMVVSTLRPATAECFAGTTVANTTGFTSPIPFTADAQTMSVRVWSPEAGVLVLFKVEDKDDAGINAETYSYTTVANGWETMVFNFADPKPNTNPINISSTYNKASIFFDFQCDNVPASTAAAADRTYYWDDVEFGGEAGGGGGGTVSQIALPVTFEDATINYELTDFGGAMQSMVITDPTDATNMVVSTVRPATAECFAGTTVANTSGFTQSIPLTASESTMSVRVWSPEAGVLVLLKVEDKDDGGRFVETYSYTTVASGWETMVFDFADPKPNGSPILEGAPYNKASIFFDFQCDNVPASTAAAADRTYYWDDVAFGVGGGGGAADPALLITGVLDGPLTGGVPKAIEFYVTEDIADLSQYGFGSANNADGTNGVEFAFPAVSASAGDYITVGSEVDGFTAFFGEAPDYDAGSAASINGDDSIELFYDANGVMITPTVPASTTVIDVFGVVGTDGSGEAWEYLDGWAYRMNSTGPDGSTFELSNWSFSGVDALDGETSNATATTPFPLGTYQNVVVPPADPTVSFVGSEATRIEGGTLVAQVQIDFGGQAPTNMPVTVMLTVDGGSADAADFTGPVPASVTFSGATDGEIQTATISIVEGDGDEPEESVTFGLSVTSGTAIVADPATYVLTIIDTDAPVIVSLADARAAGPGAFVSFIGTVTRAQNDFTYLQDETGGLAIRQTSGAFSDGVESGAIAPGTRIRVSGTLSEFRNLLQINGSDLDSYAIGGVRAIPTPQVVTLSQLAANGEAYESELVYVPNATIDGGGATEFGAGTNYGISDDSDATNAVSLRVPNADDTEIDGTSIPTTTANVTGIVSQFEREPATGATTGYQILVIGAGDVQAATAGEDDIDRPEASLTVANPLQGNATIRFATGVAGRASLSLYDALGRQVVMLVDGTVGGNTQSVSLDASTLASGVYVLRLQADDTVISRTLTVVR